MKNRISVFVIGILLLVSFTTLFSQSDWIRCADMPVSSIGHATCYSLWDDLLRAYFGYDGGSTYHPYGFLYNPVNDLWSMHYVLPLSLVLADATVIQWNQSIYIMNDSLTIILNPDSVYYGASMPERRSSGSQAAYNDSLIFYLGGMGPGGPSADVQVYNTCTDSWTVGTFLPIVYCFGNASCVDDTLFIVGGHNGGSALANILHGEITQGNCESINWSNGDPLPVPVMLNAVTKVSHNSEYYLCSVGGLEYASNITANAWEYSVSSHHWDSLPDYPMSICRQGIATREGYNEIYVCGGDNSGGWTATNQVWKILRWPQSIGKKKSFLTFAFQSITPNPCADSKISIAYILYEEGPISIKIFDLSGRAVKTLVNKENEKTGFFEITWDGKNHFHQDIPAGLYFCVIQTIKEREVRKFIAIR